MIESYIYVLLLEGDYYYVGMSTNIRLRLWEHFKMGKKSGSAWTRKHKPLKVIHLSKIVGNITRLKEIENEVTLRLAKLKGFEKVRGAGFCLSTDNVPEKWKLRLDNIKPADINKMIEVKDKELKEMLKGQFEVWKNNKKKFGS